MDLKSRILGETFKLLMLVGVSSMTMDTVAKSCGISKRTLYENFSDKATLITETFRLHGSIQRNELRIIYSQSESRMDGLLKVYSAIRDSITQVPPVLISDIRRLYPTLYKEFEDINRNNLDILAAILKVGQEEGSIRTNISTRAATYLFGLTLHAIKNSDISKEVNLSPTKVLDEVFINFIRGIATVKGIEIIDRYIDMHFNDNK